MNRLYQVIFSHSPPASTLSIPGFWIFCLLDIFPGATHGDQSAIESAAIHSFSGPLAESNLDSVRGVRMAAEEINAAGGLLGRWLEHLRIDGPGTPIGSRTVAPNALQNDVTAIIRVALSTQSLAIARVAREHGIPMISNSPTNAQVTRIGDCIFRVCYNDRLRRPGQRGGDHENSGRSKNLSKADAPPAEGQNTDPALLELISG